MSTFWVFDYYETFIDYRGFFNLNRYIGKIVQIIFFYGFKYLVKLGVGRFFYFRPKLKKKALGK